ncbi:MAG: helix-turn-helix transcriptional regulator [Synechococcales cyanobacterium CRU_2_2]|nr:helix-turn-helix transcriptional regulator [Synechococcales cyanobacterium CRU_2_2]
MILKAPGPKVRGLSEVVVAVKNTIRALLERRGITAYRFQLDTGLALRTAYDLFNDPSRIPSGAAMNKICAAYGIQPGAFLAWEED